MNIHRAIPRPPWLVLSFSWLILAASACHHRPGIETGAAPERGEVPPRQEPGDTTPTPRDTTPTPRDTTPTPSPRDSLR
jgi:hypothetical protein